MSKRNTFLATITSGIWLFSCLSAPGQNLISNGDFSAGLTGWAGTANGSVSIMADGTLGNPAGSAALARSSTAAVDNGNYLYQIVSVSNGLQYLLSADWQGDLLNGGTGRNWAEVYINFGPSIASLDPTTNPGSILYKKATDGGPNDVPMPWTWEDITASPNGGPVDGIFTASDSYMLVAFNLGGRAVTSNNTQPGFFNVDNVSLTPWPPISQPVFTNMVRAGADIILQGGNGLPNTVYQVKRSFDLTQPLTNWLAVGTDAFDLNGDFSFTDVLPADAANFYRLEALSQVGVPEITAQPQDRVAVVGQSVDFSVTAEGAPPLHYQWFYNTSTVLTDQTNSLLTLNNVQLTNAGTYSAIITNLFGSTNSVLAELTVSTNFTVAVPDGYATQNGGTTGGGNATPIMVSTEAAFRSAVGNNTPAVVIVEGMINLNGDVTIGSNKTVMGADTSAGLFNGTVRIQGSNYIIQKLAFGPSNNGDDVLEISGANNVFITKCEFHDSDDELCSIVRQADYVTVSWSKFYFDNPDSHSYAHLIGNGDDVVADRGTLHVTLHHNWYAEGIRGRMPRVRFGHVHVYNNYFNSVGNGYCVGVGFECHIRLESSHFENVNSPWADYGGTSNGEMGWDNLLFTGSSQPTFVPNSFPVFAPPYPYTMDAVGDVKSLVTAGAGNVQ